MWLVAYYHENQNSFIIGQRQQPDRYLQQRGLCWLQRIRWDAVFRWSPTGAFGATLRWPMPVCDDVVAGAERSRQRLSRWRMACRETTGNKASAFDPGRRSALPVLIIGCKTRKHKDRGIATRIGYALSRCLCFFKIGSDRNSPVWKSSINIELLESSYGFSNAVLKFFFHNRKFNF